jgi:hypothetical protein
MWSYGTAALPTISKITHHLAAYDEVVTAVQEIPRPKPLPTPWSHCLRPKAETAQFLIESEVETEMSLKISRMVVRVSERVHLVELTARYMEENEAKRAAPKRDGIESWLDYHLWIGLPTSSSQKKGNQLSQKEGCPREAAKRTLEYWIRLGEPLVRMAQRFGHGILLLLPENLTDKKLVLASLPLMELVVMFC